jgi:cellulose biosynthesis protein BcsQ
VKVFAAYNIKGGVGKTATAVNLADLSARGGFRTLVWDLDPQGAATFYFRIKPKIRGGSRKLIKGKTDADSQIRGTDFPRLDLLPADFSYRLMDIDLNRTDAPREQLANVLRPIADAYDHVFLDCPPSISLVSESVFAASDALLVPTIPTTLSLRTLHQLYRHLRRSGEDLPALLPFFCMVDRRRRLHRRICDDAREQPESMLATAIPYSSVIERMGIQRAPLSTYARSGRAAKAYTALWEEILTRSQG